MATIDIDNRPQNYSQFGSEQGKRLVLFDGVCNLCDGFVNFVFDRDKPGRFSFVPIQSEYGKYLVSKYNMPKNVTSVVYINGSTPEPKAFAQSAAVLHIMEDLAYPWPLASWFLLVPTIVRDLVYNLIAANRYRMFGKGKSSCSFKPGLRKRFLDWYEPDESELLDSKDSCVKTV